MTTDVHSDEDQLYNSYEDQLYNSYIEASKAFRDALNVALEALAECANVSVEEQDEIIIQAREMLDEMFHGAAERLDENHSSDGLDVLLEARLASLFHGEIAATVRWFEKWKK